MPLDKRVVVVHVFAALQDSARYALENLRDCAKHDATTVRDWAADHNIECPSVVEYAAGLLRFWSLNPGEAATLHTRWQVPLTLIVRPLSESERAWIESQKQCISMVLPDPAFESMSAWVSRAKELYLEREQIIYPRGRTQKPPKSEPEIDLDTKCKWFVLARVVGRYPKEIARDERGRHRDNEVESRRTQIQHAVGEVAKALELPTRRVIS